MQVWTKPQFKTASEKNFSKRDGTIKEIDDKLVEYHDPALDNDPDGKGTKLEELWAKIVKFEDEKKLKYANTIFRQSKKRKNAVHTLRTQVEWHMWQRKYDQEKPTREDLRKFFAKKRTAEDHDEVLFQYLLKLKIQVKQGSTATSDLKKKLHADIESEFGAPFAGKRWFEEGMKSGKFPWASDNFAKLPYLGGDPLKPALPSMLRIATVDLEAAIGNGDFAYMGMDFAKLTPADKTAMFFKITDDRDNMISYLQSQNQVAEYMSPALRGTMEQYLRSLLTVDLDQQCKLIQRALDSKRGDYKAIVHLDYYATRDVDQVGLHKDTTGHNVFAVLNYLNDNPMLGPEYIDDPAPIKSANPGWHRDDIWATLPGYTRSGAPWAEIAKDKYVWPDALIEALQWARMYPANTDSQGKMAASILPKDALVSFVDELIFHATPIAGLRTERPAKDHERYLHAGASFPTLLKDGKHSGDILKLFEAHVKKDRVERRMSAHYNNGVHIETGLEVPGAKSGGVRRFFRLWMCIVPAHWYKANAKYT